MKKRILCLAIAFVFIFSTHALAYKMDSYNRELRIGLKNMLYPMIKVTFNGDYLCGEELYKLGTSIVIQNINGKIMIDEKEYDELQFNPLGSENTIILENGAKRYNFRGSMIFRPDVNGIIPINLIKVDDYLKGVVAYEMSNSYPIEALKAQAVAARNYALTNIGKHGQLGYDLCDGTDCQVYRGYNPAYQRVNNAVEETKGMLLLYNDSLVSCYYSASNGGFTEDSKNPWGSSVPYLIVQRDDFDNEQWPYGDKSFTTLQIDEKLKEKGIILGDDTFVRIDLLSIERYQDIRISKLNLVVRDINGIERIVEIKREGVRTFLSLPSTYYNVVYDEATDTYTFSGKGYGHGIGMSQIGARNRANAGQKYDEILKFYYYGSSFTNANADILILTQDKNIAMVGEEVKFDVGMSGNASNKLYKYVVMLGNTVEYIRDYSSEPSYVFKGQKPGNYNISLYIKSFDSISQYDDLKTTTLSVFEAPVLEDIQLLTKEPYVNKPVSLSSSIKGGSGAEIKCTVELLKDGSLLETKEVAEPSYTFTPKVAGEYLLRIKIKDTMSSRDIDDVKEIKLNVKAEVKVVTAFKFTRTLKKGVGGNDVKNLQEVLKKLGYYKYPSITNYFGSVTQTAVASFQKGNKLPANGIVDKKTADAINKKLVSKTSTAVVTLSKPSINPPTPSRGRIVYAPKRTLKLGMNGGDVKTLQDLLARLGYYKGRPTGYFGSVTVNSVKKFQKAFGLKQTGIVDSAVVRRINEKVNR